MDDNGLAWAQAQYDAQEPPEPEPKLLCSHCGQGIYEGERYFTVNGLDYCEECAEFEFGRLA